MELKKLFNDKKLVILSLFFLSCFLNLLYLFMDLDHFLLLFTTLVLIFACIGIEEIIRIFLFRKYPNYSYEQVEYIIKNNEKIHSKKEIEEYLSSQDIHLGERVISFLRRDFHKMLSSIIQNNFLLILTILLIPLFFINSYILGSIFTIFLFIFLLTHVILYLIYKNQLTFFSIFITVIYSLFYFSLIFGIISMFLILLFIPLIKYFFSIYSIFLGSILIMIFLKIWDIFYCKFYFHLFKIKFRRLNFVYIFILSFIFFISFYILFLNFQEKNLEELDKDLIRYTPYFVKLYPEYDVMDFKEEISFLQELDPIFEIKLLEIKEIKEDLSSFEKNYLYYDYFNQDIIESSYFIKKGTIEHFQYPNFLIENDFYRNISSEEFEFILENISLLISQNSLLQDFKVRGIYLDESYHCKLDSIEFGNYSLQETVKKFISNCIISQFYSEFILEYQNYYNSFSQELYDKLDSLENLSLKDEVIVETWKLDLIGSHISCEEDNLICLEQKKNLIDFLDSLKINYVYF